MPPMIAQIQKAPLTLPGTDSGGTKRDSHAITTKTENTNWNTLNLNAFRCVFTSWWNVSLNKVVGQLARQVKLKEKDFIEYNKYNTKNQGRVSECPKENEFRSGGQNCTTSEPENVREIFFSGTWIMTEQNAVSQVTRQGKTKQGSNWIIFQTPTMFSQNKFCSNPIIFQMSAEQIFVWPGYFPTDYKHRYRKLYLYEFYIYFSCVFALYICMSIWWWRMYCG